MAVRLEAIPGIEHFRLVMPGFVTKIREGVNSLLSSSTKSPDPDKPISQTSRHQIEAANQMFEDLIKGQKAGNLPSRFIQ